MRKRLSFGYINIIGDNIAEIIIDNNVMISLEMLEEYHHYLNDKFDGNFGLLINRINNYSFTFEAKLTIETNDKLCAIAVIYYSRLSKESALSLMDNRINDDLNLQLFSGLELGKQAGVSWLESEISIHNKIK